MADPRFFTNHGPFSLSDIVNWSQTQLHAPSASGLVISDVAPLDKAQSDHLTFFDNPKYLEQFRQSSAGACFVKEKYVAQAPKEMTLLIAADPYRAYALITQRFYPKQNPQSIVSDYARIDPKASVGGGCQIDAGAVVGAFATIGENCTIGANAVIGDGVQIGAECHIGPNASLSHCHIGERSIIHRGVNIGQDGFGFAMGREGHVKVPQLGRVVIGSDVEIGAGSCVDRGTGPDTHIGDGTKIDNLVQIAHNVQIGRGCIIVSQSGVAGSTKVGDGVIIGGQVGVAGHLTVGPGARLAARSGVTSDLEAGKAYGGTPAVPIKDWHRQTIALNDLVKKKKQRA